jgi:outer membrane protein insertion porin family
MEEHLLNRLWSAAFGDQNWVVSDLEFAKYLRLDLDATYSREFRKDLVGAFRISSGMAKTFGDTRSVPFVKQFFVGGPSSIRAWRIREIGPGGFYDPTAQFPFYEAADFRFEFNGELRFPMFWWLKGAVFMDGGNIWTLQPELERPNSELRWDSYKNIALGTGFGVRGDFSYFILRFDWGLPLRNPYASNSDGKSVYWIKDRFSKLQFRDFRPNIAVGYPF